MPWVAEPLPYREYTMRHPSTHSAYPFTFAYPQGACPRCGGTGIVRRPDSNDQLACTCLPARRYAYAILDLLEATAKEAVACLVRSGIDGWGACYHHGYAYSLERRQGHDQVGNIGEYYLDPDMPIAIAELIGLADPPTVLRLVALARQGLTSHAP